MIVYQFAPKWLKDIGKKIQIMDMQHDSWSLGQLIGWLVSQGFQKVCPQDWEFQRSPGYISAWGSDLQIPGILVWLSSTRRRSWGRALGQKWDLPQLGWCLDETNQTDPVSWRAEKKHPFFRYGRYAGFLPRDGLKNSLENVDDGLNKNEPRKSENIIHHYKMTCWRLVTSIQ